MNLISFIYRLIEKFVPITKAELLQIEREAENWYNEQLLSENKTKKVIMHHMEAWYTKTFFAVMFLFALKWVTDALNPKDEYEEEEDERD